MENTTSPAASSQEDGRAKAAAISPGRSSTSDAGPAGLVVFSTVLPYLLYTRGLSRVEAGRASIMASLEPVVASLTGAVVFGEPLGLITAAGIVCVLAGVWILR